MSTPQDISSLLKQIEADPKNVELYQKLGHAYLKHGRTAKARGAYDKALELDSTDPWTHLFVGNWHFAAGAYRKALDHF